MHTTLNWNINAYIYNVAFWSIICLDSWKLIAYMTKAPTSLPTPSPTMQHLLPGNGKDGTFYQKTGKCNWLCNITISPLSLHLLYRFFFLLQPFKLILDTKTIEIENAFRHRESNSLCFHLLQHNKHNYSGYGLTLKDQHRYEWLCSPKSLSCSTSGFIALRLKEHFILLDNLCF